MTSLHIMQNARKMIVQVLKVFLFFFFLKPIAQVMKHAREGIHPDFETQRGPVADLGFPRGGGTNFPGGAII